MNNFYFSTNMDNRFKLVVSRETFYKYVNKFESEFRRVEYCRTGRVFFLFPNEMSMRLFSRFCKFDAELSKNPKLFEKYPYFKANY